MKNGACLLTATLVGLVLAVAPAGESSLAWAEPDARAAGEPAGRGEAKISSDVSEGETAAEARRGGRYDPRDQPAEGGAYFYRQIALALVVTGAMVACLVWIVRRQSRR